MFVFYNFQMKRLRVREVRTFSQDHKASREQKYTLWLWLVSHLLHSTQLGRGPRHKDLLPSPEQMHQRSSLTAEH